MSPDRELEWELRPQRRMYFPDLQYGHTQPTAIWLWDREELGAWDARDELAGPVVAVLHLTPPEKPIPWHRRLLMATTPEGRLKKKVKALLKERGAWSYMPSQNGMGVVGIPDFMCCYKGLLLGIETKAPLKNPTTAEQRWKKATPNQQNRITEIREAGGLAEVVDDIEQVEHMLRVADVRAALMHGIHPTGGLFE